MKQKKKNERKIKESKNLKFLTKQNNLNLIKEIKKEKKYYRKRR